MIILQVCFIVFLYASFGIVHTLFATLHFKGIIASKWISLMPYYRLTYNVISVIQFYFVYELTPSIDIHLYDLKPPYDIIILVPQFFSLMGILWTLRYFDAMEFIGISQIFRQRAGNYNSSQLDEESTLIIKGPYKMCRHPLYFFCILFLLFRPYMFLDYLLSFICITAYFYIGSVYEENKMVERFGEKYKEYQLEVPRIIPIRKSYLLFH